MTIVVQSRLNWFIEISDLKSLRLSNNSQQQLQVILDIEKIVKSHQAKGNIVPGKNLLLKIF